jgi:predicted O-methyltransferase YrrM|mmetsp:Transcript_26633/g.42643  ORF Transcript_26633/g.42643 Transcript_26633/m.42643 type:complete len:316 (-) Transcript_26633:4-951(-)
MTTDLLDFGVLLLSCEAFRGARYETILWNFICTKTPVRRDIQEILAGVSRDVRRPDAWIGKDSDMFAGAMVARHGGHAQHKLAMLVQHLEATITRGSGLAARVLEEVVEFSLKKFNYWLKVAADTKATLIDNVLEHASKSMHRIRLEMGAFVGFSGLRLSGATILSEEVLSLESWRVMSLEVDPLHVCVARHVLNLGERASVAEVRTGQVRDLLPRIFEERGNFCLGLAFMDHRGTRFHNEMYLLEQQFMMTSQMDAICDNVLHPGAPIFLWEESQLGTSRVATVWSLPEFGGEGCIEDWMAFERYEPRLRISHD